MGTLRKIRRAKLSLLMTMFLVTTGIILGIVSLFYRSDLSVMAFTLNAATAIVSTMVSLQMYVTASMEALEVEG